MINTEMPTTYAFAKEELCRTPLFISAKVSPDGKLIARVGADEEGISNVSIFPIDDDSKSAEKLSFFQTPEIIQFFWSPDSKMILLLKDENGTGQLNLHGFEIDSKKHHSYTKTFSNVNAKLIKLSSKENKAVIGLNHRNPHFHDLYILDLYSGEMILLFGNDSFAKFLISDELSILLKIRILADSSWEIFTHANDLFMSLTAADAFQTEFLSHESKTNWVYFLDNRYSNTNQLTKKSLLAPYPEEVVGGQLDSDVDEVIFINEQPHAYATYYTQKKWHPLHPSIQEDLHFLEKQVGSNFEVISQSKDHNLWIVSNSIPDQGNFFWRYKRDDRSLVQLSPTKSEANEKNYSKMYEYLVTARDGETLVCYYTLPKEHDKGGFVDSPIPLVVFPHGGPFKVRDRFEFHPFHQWLATCGYAVLSVNFRLSSGFGKAFVNAGNGEWGGKAHLDVLDAVEACIAKGIADKSKLAIVGGSYGGYETLAALTFTPDYFTCCVSICGPSNLQTVLKSVPQFWEFTTKPLSDKTMFFTKQAFITSMGGSPDDPKGVVY